jgi:hypothetical protein
MKGSNLTAKLHCVERAERSRKETWLIHEIAPLLKIWLKPKSSQNHRSCSLRPWQPISRRWQRLDDTKSARNLFEWEKSEAKKSSENEGGEGQIFRWKKSLIWSGQKCRVNASICPETLRDLFEFSRSVCRLFVWPGRSIWSDKWGEFWAKRFA